ncbi:MAG TPA: nitrate reductase associated protein [Candidatus Binataceae bacterium]|nr:nitrate reductase associated protein [Candidatus Binataceae bacterium]HVA79682.1 nitrate reductase associated protein [Candidatus Binataceae bacterium]
MIRKFQFEAEIYESLSCLPMAARRKLDAVGIKIGRAQWAQLGRGERLMICHAPAESAEECAALRLFIDETVLARAGGHPVELDADARRSAVAPASVPDRLAVNAAALGLPMTQPAWTALDDDARYALVKLGDGAKPSHNLRAALLELVGAPNH